MNSYDSDSDSDVDVIINVQSNFDPIIVAARKSKHPLFKTKQCMNVINGKCTRKYCDFYHNESDRRFPQCNNGSNCISYMNNSPQCKYTHPNESVVDRIKRVNVEPIQYTRQIQPQRMHPTQLQQMYPHHPHQMHTHPHYPHPMYPPHFQQMYQHPVYLQQMHPPPPPPPPPQQLQQMHPHPPPHPQHKEQITVIRCSRDMAPIILQSMFEKGITNIKIEIE